MKKNMTVLRAIGIASLMGMFCFEAEAASLDVLIQEAHDNNPHIQETFYQWKAAEYKIKRVNALEDPQVSYSYFLSNRYLQAVVGQ